MWSMPSIGFLSPWLLLGFAAVPVIWWLLRFTPPSPRQLVFPPTRLLEGLRSKDTTPARSPWWLTLLRILIVSLVILALSGPIFNPEREFTVGERPMLLVIDNGWSAASRWDKRQERITAVLDLAQQAGQPVILAPTAGLRDGWVPQRMSPAQARDKAADIVPEPFAPARAELAQRLGEEAGALQDMSVIWLADGVAHDDAGARALGVTLSQIASTAGSLRIFSDGDTSPPLGVHGYIDTANGLRARVIRPAGPAQVGKVYAMSARSEVLAEAEFQFAQGASVAEAAFSMPLELRNQVTALRIAGERSAGATYLLDSRAQWRRVAIISGEALDRAQPLLSQSYYIERAVSPFADLVVDATSNLDAASANVLAREPSVLILADVGQLIGRSQALITQWVEDGGVLVRFAGSRLENSGDALLPVPLRTGGRVLGGALSWSEPQKLAPITEDSPFFGIALAEDIRVERQILADPSGDLSDTQIWMRLDDGTPLVTASRRSAGWIIMFHVTANSDWSNLPMSGTFVDMLRRIISMSNPAGTSGSGADDNPAAASGENASALSFDARTLAPREVLDGYGALVAPRVAVGAINAHEFADAVASPTTPPGFYGTPGRTRALNVIGAETTLAPLNLPQGAEIARYEQRASLKLSPWLFMAALLIFTIESLAIFTLRVLRRGQLHRAGAAAGLVAGLIGCAMLSLGSGGAYAKADARDDPGAMPPGALQTHLAYVITGDASVDQISRAGLQGLSRLLSARTAVEPGEPLGVNPDRDELVFFPILYWPVLPNVEPLDDQVLAKVDAYMKQGGMIIFDTRDQDQNPFQVLGMGTPRSAGLANLIGRLDIPQLEPVPNDHVLTKAFYLLDNFPGRWDGGTMWVEARDDTAGDGARRALKADGVSSIIITSNDFAAAWALDESSRPLLPVVPGGEVQREIAFRTGINIVIYALTGNYKADQVHLPALLERLGQ
jgi:hypothetical protein